MDDLDRRVKDKRRKRELIAERALEALRAWRDAEELRPAASAGA